MSKNQIVLPHARTKKLLFWLLVTLFMIFGMVVLGGLTRLTGSGLSMVEWKPLTGIFPPFNENDWQDLFVQYQSSPEFLKVNTDMDLTGFKQIFWLEFIHRLWGRLIGLMFLIPLGMALVSRDLRGAYGWRLAGIWVLGGLQGVVGWYMVKSGLINEPSVSPYRLALHLLLAFATYGWVLWLYLELKIKNTVAVTYPKSLKKWVWGSFLFAIATIFYGALVAGLKAGLMYNTFPTLDGDWVPQELTQLPFAFHNMVSVPGLVQWVHRCLALLTVSSVIVMWSHYPQVDKTLRKILHLTFLMTLIQMGLGIVTLLTQVHLIVATLHQAGALLTLTSLIVLLFYGRLLKSRHTGQDFPLKSLKEGAA